MRGATCWGRAGRTPCRVTLERTRPRPAAREIDAETVTNRAPYLRSGPDHRRARGLSRFVGATETSGLGHRDAADRQHRGRRERAIEGDDERRGRERAART